MGNNYHKRSQNRLLKFVLYFLVAVILLSVVGVFFLKRSYDSNLLPVSNVSRKVPITVKQGETTSQIATDLKSNNLIRSTWAFEVYMRINRSSSTIQAGTYAVNQNQSVPEIVKMFTNGEVSTEYITILPGKTLEQIKNSFIESGYSSSEVAAALDPSQYTGHPALSEKPADASLEGYLYPETFQKTASTSLKDVVKMSLDEMNKHLTDEIKAGFKRQNLTVHQALTLASIVQNEVHESNDSAQVAQVFLKRLSIGMKLESNATDKYAEANPEYDTYSIPGLPPGPISNMLDVSIRAVAFPASTDWLFFVSGDDDKTYFSKTSEEHTELVRQHCQQKCTPH